MVGKQERGDKVKQIPITFPCGNINLSGYIYLPDKNGTFPGVILCHPHPLYGGSMSVTIIRELGTALIARDIIAMMFNFRGVGKSGGQHGGGLGEREDVKAAIEWILKQPQVDTKKIGLAGYSFGGGVAAPAGCENKHIAALALISPALDESGIESLQQCFTPKLFTAGGQDDMVPAQSIEYAFQKASEPKQFELIPRADHFYTGIESEVIKLVADFFKKIFA